MKNQSILISTAFIIVFAGCSGSNPIQTDNDDLDKISTHEIHSSSNHYPGVFGAWQIHLNKDDLSAEIIPSRNSKAIGDIFDSDLSQFLTVSPCANCLAITDVQWDIDYNIRVGFRMKHPFGNLNARPDLHGFDVRLIFIMPAQFEQFPDIFVMKPDTSIEGAFLSAYYLLNPDGWTSHYDDLVTDERYFIGGQDIPGNLNPFIRYFEDYAVTPFDPMNPDGQNVMPVGSNYETKTAIFFSQFVWDYGVDLYAVADVAYGQSAVLANRKNPQYYLPAFHRTEPWRVEYWNENNNLKEDDPTSTADMVVQVFDWQHGATVDPNYPDPANKSGIPVSSNVLRLELSIPDLQDDLIIVNTPESGTGSPSDPLQYRLQVMNKNTTSGMSSGLLAVRDELYGETGRLPVPASPAGFPYETADILDYTLYQLVFVNMPNLVSGFEEYQGELNVDSECRFVRGSQAQISARFFMDISKTKFQYRWDYDYDGVTFDIDGAGMPSPEFDVARDGINHIGLRVRTNSVPPRQYIYDIPIYVEGVGFDSIINTPGDHLDATFQSNNQAVAISSEHYYVAYTSEANGHRDIWLAIGDASGTFTTSCLTTSISEACYNPSMIAVEDGAHDGLYILFVRDDSIHTGDLYSIWGNLDGSNFDPSHISTVSSGLLSSADEASLVYNNGKLYAYYAYWSSLSGTDIAVSYSDNMGGSWTYHGLVNSHTDDLQSNPAAVYSPVWGIKKCFVVWEDYRDLAERGSDLYMASSSNLLDFSTEINISTFPDNTFELAPAITFYSAQLGVAYLALNGTTGLKNVYLKVIDPVPSNLVFDYKINTGLTDYTHTYPAVSTSCYGRFLVAYGLYNQTTNNMKAYVVEVESDGPISSWYDRKMYEFDAGTLISVDPQIYPGLASRAISRSIATESLVTFTSFANGFTESTDPFKMYFGDVKAVQVISSIEGIYP